mgnify:CR=1 FL=1
MRALAIGRIELENSGVAIAQISIGDQVVFYKEVLHSGVIDIGKIDKNEKVSVDLVKTNNWPDGFEIEEGEVGIRPFIVMDDYHICRFNT